MAQKYITFGDVQNYIIEYYGTTKKCLDFRTAYGQLLENVEETTDAPDLPDFLNWDKRKISDLVQLAYTIPIFSSEINQVIPHYYSDSNTTILPTIAEIQINFETAYSPDTFISLDYFIILYALEGTTTISMPQKKISLKTGELVILPPGIPHYSFHWPRDHVLNIMSNKQHFETNFFQLFKTENILSSFFKHTLGSSRSEFLVFQLPVTMQTCSLIAHLFAEYISDNFYASPVFHNYLQIFYFNILRSSSTTHNEIILEKKHNPEIIMMSVIQYIQKNYRTTSLQDLADLFHYDSAYLSKLIKKYTGQTYSHLVTELKIEESKKLLLKSDFSIESIAEKVGYHSSDHFSHTFKSIVKISPMKFRKLNRSSSPLDIRMHP